MKTKFTFTFLLILLLFNFTNAQETTVKSIGENKTSQLSKISNQDSFIEKSKELLVGFDEAEVMQQLKIKGVSVEDLAEALKGQKIKYIKNKQNNIIKVSPALINKTLSACDNIGFEYGDFTNWEGALGTLNSSTWGACPNPTDTLTFTTGFSLGANNLISNAITGSLGSASSERHVLLTCPTCHDTIARNPNNGAYEIPYLAPNGSAFSARLGNANFGGETEKLSYPIVVTPNNSLFTYRYALVFQNPLSHVLANEPFFTFHINDSLGQPLANACGNLCYHASLITDYYSHVLPSNSIYNCDQSNDIFYTTWKEVSVNLSNYIGQKLTLEFTTGDCSIGGHFGYAYVDATCAPWQNTLTYTFNPLDTIGCLIAPLNFAEYQWMDSLGNVFPGAVNDTFFVHNPAPCSKFYVNVKSDTSANCASLVEVKIFCPSGVATQIKNNSNVELFPNPAKNEINLCFQAQAETNFCIEIESILGKKLYRENYTMQGSGKQTKVIDLKELNPGIYFLSLTLDGKKIIKKFIHER